MPTLTEAMIEPRLDWVLLRLEAIQETSGGLILPEHSSLNETIARVVRVGPGLFQPITDAVDLAEANAGLEDEEREFGWHVPSGVERGDLVMFQRPEGHPDVIQVDAGLFLVRNFMIVATLATG